MLESNSFVCALLLGLGLAYGSAWSQQDERRSVPGVDLPEARADFSGCIAQFAGGVAPIVPDLASRRARPLCFDGFAVMHSGESKTAIFSASVLNRQRVQAAKSNRRTDFFFSDARLPRTERATLEDYAGSGFDRGHLSPAGDQDTPEGMAQSFSLANIVPQATENNRGVWSKIKQDTRKYVERARGNVYVITGVVSLPGQCPISAPSCTIGAEVKVPSHLYKLVFDSTTRRAWAHWIENRNVAEVSRPISYEELVRRVGVEFLLGLSPRF